MCEQGHHTVGCGDHVGGRRQPWDVRQLDAHCAATGGDHEFDATEVVSSRAGHGVDTRVDVVGQNGIRQRAERSGNRGLKPRRDRDVFGDEAANARELGGNNGRRSVALVERHRERTRATL